MNTGKLDRNSPIQVFEVKHIRRDFNYKITSADVFNDFLYIGDEKGTLYTSQAIFISPLSGSMILISSPNLLRNMPKI